jgi:hypothetical protein
MLDGGQKSEYARVRGAIVSLKGELDSLLVSSQNQKKILNIIAKTFEVARRDLADPLLDLRDFCEELIRNVNSSSLEKKLKDAVLLQVQNVIKLHDEVVKQHERRGPLVTGMHGIGISAYAITENWSREHTSVVYDKVDMRHPPVSGPRPPVARQRRV